MIDSEDSYKQLIS